MDGFSRLRHAILSMIVRDLPLGFWEDARTRAMQTYLDIFHEIKSDPNALDEQRLDKLYQDRHFRMERLLADLAKKHGLACSPTILDENNRRYVYVTKGSFGLTQTYVQAIGGMPHPARFRERLAAMNGIPDEPRLDFGDEPREVLLEKEFYGLLAHNPVGKRFIENDQKLGMIQFCVPSPGCTRWALQLTIQEIISAYEVAKPEQKPERRLAWKKGRGSKRESK